MTVFYRGPLAHITHEVFQAQSPVRESFPIRELRAIHIVQSSRPHHPGSVWLTLGGMTIGVIAIALAAPSWPTIGLLVLAVSSVITVGCVKPAGTPLQLRATYRGRAVCLLQTNDRTMLGQVSRALIRAVERTAERR